MSPNALFVDRNDSLKWLAAALKKRGASIVIAGLGGIGKSQLASEFVYRYGQYFLGGVFWLSFAEPEAIRGQIIDCGRTTMAYLQFASLPLEAQLFLESPVPGTTRFHACCF